jgi:hypothetical protein
MCRRPAVGWDRGFESGPSSGESTANSPHTASARLPWTRGRLCEPHTSRAVLVQLLLRLHELNPFSTSLSCVKNVSGAKTALPHCAQSPDV